MALAEALLRADIERERALLLVFRSEHALVHGILLVIELAPLALLLLEALREQLQYVVVRSASVRQLLD